MNRGPVLLWVRHPPHSTVHFSEGVRVAAMTSALGTPVRLLFIADGVRALVNGQEPYRLGPPVDKSLRDIVTSERPALVHAPSLALRGLGPERLSRGVPFRLVDDTEVADLLLGSAHVVPL